jgi:phospholipid/cholesterol/gamma-HCH transport system ATP-binding protein
VVAFYRVTGPKELTILDQTSKNLVEVTDLHFSYGNREILKGINLSIPRGKIVAILGVSGCGKTTLLRHFGGQLRPSRGSVKFQGKVVHELGSDELYALRREMGMMFQVSGRSRCASIPNFRRN